MTEQLELQEESPPIGHNSKSDNPFDALKIEFESDEEQAQLLLKQPIETQEQADAVAFWSKRIALISKKATDLHKVEKQPHLDAGRAVDDKWRDLKENPKSLSDKMKRHLDDWLRKRAVIEAERQRHAREEAERLRLEAEKLQAESNKEAQDQIEIYNLHRQAALAEKQSKEMNVSAGRIGSKVALRTFVSARIVDYKKAMMALKDHPEMKALVEQLANRAVRAGHHLNGVERVEEKRSA